MTTCPCGSGQMLAACCTPYIDGTPALTAEILMRSRYTAHTLGNGQYLKDTLSIEQQADFDVAEFEASADKTQWLGLEIRKTEKGGEKDETGTVEFVARYKEPGTGAVVHHELSYFKRENNRWVFADCTMNPKGEQRRVEKVGRNDPCTCGSGKKFKKCCGA